MEDIIKNRLIKIASDDSGWDLLFFDKKTQTYWEKIYPNSSFHGGGKAEFKEVLLTESIIDKYKIENKNI